MSRFNHLTHPMNIMQIGIDSFVETPLGSGRAPGELGAERVHQLLEEIELADRVGIDVYGIGEHHREEYIASSPAVLLAAAAARTQTDPAYEQLIQPDGPILFAGDHCSHLIAWQEGASLSALYAIQQLNEKVKSARLTQQPGIVVA